jgi:hypothetical protein
MNDDTAPVPREAYKKLPSGVIIADLRPGNNNDNNVVKEGSRVNLQWVLRKSNGYFVDSSQTNDSVPFIFTVGDGTAIAGVDEGVRYALHFDGCLSCKMQCFPDSALLSHLPVSGALITFFPLLFLPQ